MRTKIEFQVIVVLDVRRIFCITFNHVFTAEFCTSSKFCGILTFDVANASGAIVAVPWRRFTCIIYYAS